MLMRLSVLFDQLPNVGGFFFSFTQMVLYFCYWKPKAQAVALPTTATATTLAGVAVLPDEELMMELPLAMPEVTIPVLAELHKMEKEVASPRRAAGVKAF